MPKRDEYVEKFKARLDQLNAQIDKLEAKTREVEADAKIEYERQLMKLRERRSEAQQKLSQIKAATGDAWKDIRHGADEAWQACVQAMDDAASRFK